MNSSIGKRVCGKLTLTSKAQPNKRMHATRDTQALKILHRVGGRVMRGVMPLLSSGCHWVVNGSRKEEIMSWFRRRLSEVDDGTFRLGDAVRLKSGPLAAFRGTVEGINQAKQLLKVVLTIFEERKTVKVKFTEVEKVPNT
jgi:transcription antitermination factor NusG